MISRKRVMAMGGQDVEGFLSPDDTSRWWATGYIGKRTTAHRVPKVREVDGDFWLITHCGRAGLSWVMIGYKEEDLPAENPKCPTCSKL